MADTVGILGGAGFIGSHLTKKLLESGYKVIVIDNFSTETKHRGLKTEDIEKLLKYRHSDVETCNDLTKVKIDRLINLAADPIEYKPMSIEQQWQFEADNVTNIRAVKYAHDHQIPYFFMSSIFAIGDFNGKVAEEVTLRPTTGYGIIKASGEYLANNYLTQCTIGRTTSVYGMGDLNNRATSIIMRKVLRGEKDIKINTSFETNFTYITDLVDDIYMLISNGHVGTYNICGDEFLGLEDYCQALSDVTGIEIQAETFSDKDRPERGEMDNSLINNLKVIYNQPQHKTLKEGLAEYWKLAQEYGVC